MDSKLQRDAERSRSMILESAATLFAEHGFNGVSVGQITEGAGVARASRRPAAVRSIVVGMDGGSGLRERRGIGRKTGNREVGEGRETDRLRGRCGGCGVRGERVGGGGWWEQRQ